MFENKEVAARHLPTAHVPAGHLVGDLRAREGQRDTRPPPAPHLHAPVVVDRDRDDRDPHADVPCTD
jgi:hypothetical protein